MVVDNGECEGKARTVRLTKSPIWLVSCLACACNTNTLLRADSFSRNSEKLYLRRGIDAKDAIDIFRGDQMREEVMST